MSELSIRTREVIVPTELLADHMNKISIPARWKFVDAFPPKRNGKADQKHGFDHDDGKFQMRRDVAAHTFMIGYGLTAAAKTNEDVDEERRPADKERGHEPMAELQNVIDLQSVLGKIRRLTE